MCVNAELNINISENTYQNQDIRDEVSTKVYGGKKGNICDFRCIFRLYINTRILPQAGPLRKSRR